MSDMFLTPEEMAILTGRKVKRLQIEALRAMGIPFFVNACNAPIVARVTIEGQAAAPAPKKTWVPPVLRPDYVPPADRKKR
jgi:hypothetical protein